jgi:hypothetical protein
MPLTGKNSGKIGVISTIFLMFSIVLFMACMFMLVSLPSFKPDPGFINPIELGRWILKPNEKIQEINSSAITLEEAISEIEEKKCTIIYYNVSNLEKNSVKLGFDEFIIKAENKNIVFIHKNDNVTLLLIPYEDSYYYWVPDNN